VTFSIVARDPLTGDLGIAVASKFLAVGAVVPHATAGVGAVATQALANVRYGPDGLALLAQGGSATQVLAELVAGDDSSAHRQAGIVDALGGAATITGGECLDWAGGRTGEGVAVQGNILAGPAVVDAMIVTYQAGGMPFPELLLDALEAGDREGGDQRGRQSAALLVVREGGGYGGGNDRWIDLRVDDHRAPIDELKRLLDINHLLMDRPAAEDLLPIDEAMADELRLLLADAGYAPSNAGRGSNLAAAVEASGMTRTGEPRAMPAGWDSGWEGALSEWMGVENLEERAAARGWIDPRVLEHLREHAR